LEVDNSSEKGRRQNELLARTERTMTPGCCGTSEALIKSNSIIKIKNPVNLCPLSFKFNATCSTFNDPVTINRQDLGSRAVG
jgi:hypothetical protein